MRVTLAQKDNMVFMANSNVVVLRLNNLRLAFLKEMVDLVPDCSKITLQAVITSKVSVDSIIYSEVLVVIMDWLMYAMINILELIAQK